MSDFEYIRQITLRSIKKNFLQHCNLSNNEAIKVWANWVIVNRIREKQIDEFLPTENLELDNKTVSLLIEKGISEDEAINFYSNFIQQCQRWKYRYEYYCADKLVPRLENDNDNEIDGNAITISILDDRSLQHVPYFPPGFPIRVSIVYGLGPTINHPNLSFSVERDLGDVDKKVQNSEASLGVIGQLDAKTVPWVFKPDAPRECIDMNTINAELIIDYRGVSNKIDSESLRRLLNCYRINRNTSTDESTYPGGVSIESSKQPPGEDYLIKFRLWKLLNNYSLLDGLSYQWSLPPETFDLLTNSCGLKAELFASPLNHHVKNYYSLFELDREFGSSGDFFESNYKDFSSGGFYEANPPFIESVFIQASQLILKYLEFAKEDKIDLSFMWIMPDWLDSFAYRRLKASSFFRKELVLRKGQHKYWEYRKNRIIQANFNTHVLILTSNDNFFQRVWPSQTESSFIKTMSY